MRRRMAVLVLVLVLGAWSCPAPPTGGGTEPMAGPTTAGYAAQAAGEPWHPVGGTGEPAFENGWDDFAGNQTLSFRLREAGIVDIAGYAFAGTPGSTVFTLPDGYRPTTITQIPITGIVSSTYNASVLQVDTSGNVRALRLVGGVAANPDGFFVSGSFFIVAPATA